jgi:putative transcriptional regulator
MRATARKKTKIDWSALDAMTEEERHAAAMADPDARPMT